MITEHNLEGLTFYGFARRFETGDAAKEAFMHLVNVDGGKLDLGVYRIIYQGIGSEATVVVIVSVKPESIQFAASEIGGTDIGHEFTEGDWTAVMLRRLRKVNEMLEAGLTGQLTEYTAHGPFGSYIHADGTVEKRRKESNAEGQ